MHQKSHKNDKKLTKMTKKWWKCKKNGHTWKK